MNSAVIILILISNAYARTMVPLYLEGKKVPLEQSINEQLTINGSAHFSAQNNNPPPSSHLYPTYPEYSNNKNGISLRTEYESYIIPTATAVQKTSGWSYENIVSSLIPFVTSLILYGTRAGTFVLRFLMVILVGVASTSLICIHTSICNISFPGKTEVKELARTYVTPENLDLFTMMMTRALDKYSSMQYNVDKDDNKEDKKSNKINKQDKSQEQYAKELSDNTKIQ
ncbi:uncharacterized protein LOC115241058 [Formica exsecta]|uniref:uncharacterized protein LOC115241058 n=1 Tax=Formica exsecta TaxID=72781 RepID=UPI001142AD2C|nr:uncharacterized protein LOC115241058 [Formica exsecta]